MISDDASKMLVEVLKKGGTLVDEKTQKRRIDICRRCEYFDENNGNPRCKDCKCFLLAKTWMKRHILEGFGLKDVECPKSKW